MAQPTTSSPQARGTSGKPVDPLTAERQRVARQLKRSVDAMGDEEVAHDEDVTASRAQAMAPTIARKVMRAETAPVPNGEPPVPRTQDAYNAHLRVKFAGQFAELKTIAEAFAAKGGEIKTKEAELSVNTEERKQLEDQFAGKKGELSEDEKKLKERMQMLQAIAPHEGSWRRSSSTVTSSRRARAKGASSIPRPSTRKRTGGSWRLLRRSAFHRRSARRWR